MTRYRITGLVLFALVLMLVFGHAQERVFALRPSWLITATGKPPIANGVVLVRDERIEAAGTRAQVAVPPGAEVIELPGQTLLPGLVDGD